LNVIGLLLAAGSATRFGSDKLRHALPHGVPIAAQSARHLRPEVARVVAVTRSAQVKQILEDEGCEAVLFDKADEGMGASLACAARAAGRAGGYLVALADMPFIRRSTIAAVREALEGGAPLAAPYFRGRRGHPVGIAGRFFESLLDLQGDEGAKRLLRENPGRLVKIPVGDPGVLRDIDTPEDLLPPVAV
jgi:molybdenum cofactor cytidylyltransferase